jgi:transcriptional regulator with XRE-family HTH domain
MRPVSAAHRALGEAIRACRHERGLSQESLGLEASLDRSYMGQVERGEKNLGFTNLLKVARALDLKPSELLRRAERLGPVGGDQPKNRP